MSYSIIGWAQNKALYSTLPVIKETASDKKTTASIQTMTQKMLFFTEQLSLHQSTICNSMLQDDCWSDGLENAEKRLLTILTNIDSFQPIFPTLSQKETFKTVVTNLIIKIAYNIDHKTEILKTSLEIRDSILTSKALRQYDRERVYWKKKRVTRAQFLRAAYIFLMERVEQLEAILLKSFPTNPYIPFPLKRRPFYPSLKPSKSSMQLKRANWYVKRLKKNLFSLEVLLPSDHTLWTQLVQSVLSPSSSIQSNVNSLLSKLRRLKPPSKASKSNLTSKRTFLMHRLFFQKKVIEKVPGIRPRRTIFPKKIFLIANRSNH